MIFSENQLFAVKNHSRNLGYMPLNPYFCNTCSPPIYIIWCAQLKNRAFVSLRKSISIEPTLNQS